MKKILLIVCGFLALLLGVVGVILPFLPTTPFILVAAICFGGSSHRLYQKLENTKYFGEFIHNYKHHGGIPLLTKKKSIVFLWAMLILSSTIFMSATAIIIASVVGIGVTTHILLLKTMK